MTPEYYYRRAAFFPVATPACALLFLFVLKLIDLPRPRALVPVSNFALFVAFTGLFSLIPFGVFVLSVILIKMPEREEDFRRTVLLAPSLIAGPFALTFALFSLVNVGWEHAIRSLAFWGVLALAVGYVYALLIEGTLWLAKRLGCVAAAR